MRSSKSTWVWPGACSGRFQLWCGSMSSGRTIFGPADFFGLSIDVFPRTTFLRNAKYATRTSGSLLCRLLIGLDSRSLDEPGVRLELLPDHRLEVGQRHGQGIDAQLEKLFAHFGRAHRGVELLVQPLDDVARGLRCDQRADPEVVVGVRIARLDGGG